MSKAKHTPGKWEISNRSEYTVVQSGLDRSIATTGGYSDNQRSEAIEIENKANARLIAAAPAMLEIMEMHIHALDNGPKSFYMKYGFNVSELSNKVRELIKKIEQ